MKLCDSPSITSIETEYFLWGKRRLFTIECLHGPCDHNSLRGYVKVGLVLPGVSYFLCLCVQGWNAKQQFHPFDCITTFRQ